MGDGEDDDGGRLYRRGRGPGREIDLASRYDAGHGRVPGKSTLSSRLPFATRSAAAQNAVLLARGAVVRVVAAGRNLTEAVTAANYAESARLSFEIRSALRRADVGLVELEQNDPDHAAAIADQIEGVRAQLREAQHDLAVLLRTAPVLEDPAVGSAEAEHAWTSKSAGSGHAGQWQPEADKLGPRLGLGHVEVRLDDEARGRTESKGARGVALGKVIYLHRDRVGPVSDPGRRVLAHELVHIAQSQLPASADLGRHVAEIEADELARTIAAGGNAVARRHIDLRSLAADSDAAAANQVPSTTALEDGTRRVAFTQQLVISRNEIEAAKRLVSEAASDRVDVARAQAIEIKAALGRVRDSFKQLHALQVDMEAHEGARLRSDYSHLDGVAALQKEERRLRAAAKTRVAAAFAPNAVQGIHLWLKVKDAVASLADGTRDWKSAGPGKAGPYTLYAHVAQRRLVFFVAFHETRQQNEWIVGADDAGLFAASAATYAAAARAALPGSDHVQHSQEDGAKATRVPSRMEEEAKGDASYQAQSGVVEFLNEGRQRANGGSGIVTAHNSNMRLQIYTKKAAQIADKLRTDIEAGTLDHMTARQRAVDGRNEVMRETRARLSPAGHAMSRAIKSDQGRSVEQMTSKKTTDLIDKAAEDPNLRAELVAESKEWGKYIDDVERTGSTAYQDAIQELGAQPSVSRAIITSSGAPRGWITQLTRFQRVAGSVVGALGVVDMVDTIVGADEGQRWHVAGKELGGFAGGIVGGEMGATGAVWLASLVVSSSAVLVVVSIIGGVVGTFAGAQGGHALPDLVGGAADLAGKALMPMGANVTGGGFTGMLERNLRNVGEGGVIDRLQDVVFEIDGEVGKCEAKIREAKDRAAMERHQKDRLDLLDRRELFDRLLAAVRSGEITAVQLMRYVDEKGL